MKRVRRWFLRLLLLLLVIILLVFAAGYFFLGTEKGFRIAANQISAHVPGLNLGEVSGDLGSGILSDEVNFENDQMVINVQGIHSQWRSGCLLNRQVCIDKVAIDELYIETFASAEPKAPTEPADIVLPGVTLPVSFDVKEILVRKLKFQPPGGGAAQQLDNVALSAVSEGERIVIHNLSAQYQQYSVVASGSITPSSDYPLNFTVNVQAENFIDEHDVQAKLILSNSLKNLHISAHSNGAVEIDIEGTAQPLDKTLPINLNIRSTQLGWPLDELSLAKAENVGITINGNLSDYKIAVKSNISGKQIPDSVLSLAGFVNTERALLPQISIQTMDGYVTGNAAASWQSGVTWVTELIAKDINPANKFDGVDGKLNAVLRADGDLIDGQWTLALSELSVDGTLRQFPIDLRVKGEKKAEGTWLLNSLTLKNDENSVYAFGELAEQWDMSVKADLPKLQNLWPGLAGGFNANVKLDGELNAPDVQLLATATIVKFNDILVRGLSLKGDIKRAALDKSELQLAIGNINLGAQEFANTRLTLEGSRAEHNIGLFSDGPQKTSIDFLAKGSLDKQFNWLGSLADVKLEVPAHAIELEQATELAWDNSTKKFSIDAHCWAIQDAKLCLNNEVLATPTGNALVSLSNYKLEQLNPFLPADSTLKGTFKADVELDWGSQHAGGYKLDLEAGIIRGGIKVINPNGLPLNFDYQTLTLSSTADSTLIDTTLNITSNSMGNANIALKLDPASEQKTIGGKVDLDGFDLGFVKAFLPEFETIGGMLSTNGYLTGHLSDPQYNGTVKIDEIVVKADTMPLSVDDGNIEAVITGKNAAITGNIKSGDGTVDVLGSAVLDPVNWRADIKLDSNDLSIQQDPIVESSVSTALTISANAESIVVRGDVDVPMATINIRELPKGATTLSDDIVIIEDEQQKKKAAELQKQEGVQLDVGVNVTLGDNVSLTGYGLTASLSGDMNVSMKTPNPLQLGGEIRIVEGLYDKYGQSLTVTDGQILFVGPINQTSLDIDAVREIDGEERVAGLHIEGQLADPQISLFTEPADKQQESILSYIVLGRDIQENNDEESNLLATAALALTLNSSRGIANSVADTLGIQELTLDARGSGDDTEVVVSGRVNDKLLLRYGRSVFEDASTLYLRYDLTKKLYIEAAEGLARAVDIFYSFSF